MVKSLEACSNSKRFLSPCTYFSFFFFCVCLLQTGTKCREFIWSSVPFNDASGPSFKHTPTTNSAAQVISTQKAEPKKYWKRVGFRNLNILRWHYQFKWLELWIQQGRIGIFISFTSSRITTRVLQPSKTKLSGWQTSKLPEQVVPVAAVHKIVSLSIWSWDVMKPEPFLGLSPLRCLLMLAILEPFLNAVFTPKDSVTLLLRILKQRNECLKKYIWQPIKFFFHCISPVGRGCSCLLSSRHHIEGNEIFLSCEFIIRRTVWAISFISVVLVDFLSQISQGRVVKWVCIRVFFIGCFWMHGPTPYSVKWCLRTGIPTALQCVHALNTASVPRLFFHNVTIKFTNRLKIEFTNEKNWWERKYERWLDLSIFYFIQWQCT